MSEITIIKPDDMHLHLRNDVRTEHATAATAKNFARAIVMPNLKPPVLTVDEALEYKKYLDDFGFGDETQYMMTLCITENTTPETVLKASQTAEVIGFKLYLAGVTTNSAGGASSIEGMKPALAKMEETGVPLLVHGEVIDHYTDIFDREKLFIDNILVKTIQEFPNLRIICEHISTKEMCDFVKESGPNIAATVTPQHMMINRNHMLFPYIQPHNFCLPVPKRELHRQAIVEAVLSGNKKFFAGTDSAPHLLHTKESACGCAGCYTSPNAVALYAETFEQNGGLLDQKDVFEAFMSKNGAAFYGLPESTETITLVQEGWQIPERYELEKNAVLVPFWANKSLSWKLKE